MVGFVTAIKRGFRRAFVWEGRATRSEYWFFALFSFLCFFVTGELSQVVPAALEVPLILVVEVGLFFPGLAVLVRRLHDTGRNGGWFWIALVPLVGSVILIVLLCLPGEAGANEYGPPPITQEPATG